MKTAFLFLLGGLVVSGCQSDPSAWQYTRTKPTQSLVGIYTPNVRTRTFLAGMYKNVKASQFELRADSSFLLQNVAQVWSGFQGPDGFETVKGRWSVGKHQDWWALKLTIQSIRQADGHLQEARMGNSAMLVGQQAPYLIHFIVGDPDTGEALQYERQ